MRDKLLCLALTLLPMFVFPQTSPGADSANKLIMNGQDCDDRTFTKEEMPPALKVSKVEYADTLGAYLISHRAFLKNQTVKFSFVVTCHGEIHSIECYEEDVRKKAVFKKAILLYSNLWLPARQNGYIVNSYVHLILEFKKDRLSIEISQ